MYGIPLTPFKGEYRQHKSLALQNLGLVADLKKDRLLLWMKERRGDAEALCKSSEFRFCVKELSNAIQKYSASGIKGDSLWTNVQKEKSCRFLVQRMNLIKAIYGEYNRIRIADASTGIIIASTHKEELGMDITNQDFFHNTLQPGVSEIIDIGSNPSTDEYYLYISRVINSEDGDQKNIAVLIMHINPEDFIRSMLHTGGGLGKTGEAILVNQDSIILTSLKYQLADGSVAKPLEYKMMGNPAMLAAHGEQGMTDSVDYRGVPVLAAYRHIRITSDLGWGLVVKIDKAEALLAAENDKMSLLLVGLMCILLVVGLVTLIARRISRPLQKLTQTVQQVEKGNFNVHLSVTTSDEIGVLSRMFNSMIQRIQNYNKDLEDQVHASTIELDEANKKLLEDIKEHKRTEIQIRKLSRVVEQSPNIVVMTDTKGNIEYVNAKFTQTTGYSFEEAVGQNPRILKSSETPQEVYEQLWKSITSGQEWRGEFCNRKKNGELYWESAKIIPIKNDEGDIINFVAIMEDMTERKQAEKEINGLAKFPSENPNPVLRIEKNGTIIFANKAGSIFLDLWDTQIGQHLPKDWHKHVLDVLRSGKSNNYEIECNNHIFSVTLTPVVEGYVNFYGLDISERKRMEDELVKMQKLESVGVLAGGIAHDFNNSLQVILSCVTLAKMCANPEDEVYKRLTYAEKVTLQATGLSRQLLTFSKGGDPIRKTIFISQLIRDSANLALSGSNVRCELDIPNDLWPVEADKGQLNQVFSNLIINAYQAMPEGGIVKVKSENINVDKNDLLSLKEGKYIRITIEDQGAGISHENLQKIFDPYFTTKEVGNGLGLATCYSIIKKHDGYIDVESEVGIGTVFHIYLPASLIVPQKKPALSKTERFSLEPDEGKGKGKGKVLLMDDEDIIRLAITQHLIRLKYEVEAARDGAEAIELYKKAIKSGKSFDAVVMDLTIPGDMGGKEATKRLLEIDPKAKVIVASGYVNDPIMAEFKKHGFEGVLNKPYEVDELDELLQKVIMEKQT